MRRAGGCQLSSVCIHYMWFDNTTSMSDAKKMYTHIFCSALFRCIWFLLQTLFCSFFWFDSSHLNSNFHKIELYFWVLIKNIKYNLIYFNFKLTKFFYNSTTKSSQPSQANTTYPTTLGNTPQEEQCSYFVSSFQFWICLPYFVTVFLIEQTKTSSLLHWGLVTLSDITCWKNASKSIRTFLKHVIG